MPQLRAPYHFVRGWAAPISSMHMGSRRMAVLWKFFTPFPQFGCPEGYERKREDYRNDFEKVQPYVNKYRTITEQRNFSMGQRAYYFTGIKGFYPTTLKKGQAHRRRRCTLKYGKGIAGARRGMKFGMPWERPQLR